MPTYTEEQKRKVVLAYGYDPEEWDFDGDRSEIVPKVKTSPSITTTPLSPQTQSVNTFGSTYKKSFLDAAPSALGAGAGIGLGIAAAPATGGLSFLIPLLSGIAGGALTREVQDELTSDEYKADLARAQNEQKAAAFLGNISTMPLSGLSPSISNLKLAGQAVPKLLTGLSRTPVERQALMNVGLGAGLSGGMSAASDLTRGEDVNIQEALLNTALGGLFSKPNIIGRNLFRFPAQVEPAQLLPDANATAQLGDVGTVETMPGLTIDQRLAAAGAPIERRADLRSGKVTAKSAPATQYDVTSKWKALPEREVSEAELSRMEGEGGIAQEQPYTNKRLEEFEQASIEKAKQDRLEALKVKAELDRQETAQLQSENAARALELKQSLEAKAITRPEQTVKPLATTEMGKEVMPDYTGVKEHDIGVAKAESPADLEARRVEARLAGEQRPLYMEEGSLTPDKNREFIGNVDYMGAVQAKRVPKAKFEMHNDYGMDTRNGWRYFKDTNTVEWNNEPSPSVKHAVENYLAKQGIENIKHRSHYKRGEFYQEEGALTQPKTKLQTEVDEALQAKGISARPTDVWTRLFQKFGLLKRNAVVSEDGTIKHALTGKPVLGETTFDNALKRFMVKVNPEKADLTTAPHELAGHVMINHLRANGTPSEKQMILKFEKLVSDSPEFKAINEARAKNGEAPWSAEEFISTEQGLEFVRRNLNLSGETPIKTWWKDLWSHLKVKWSKNATPEEFRRLLQYKFQYDPAFHSAESTGVKIANPLNMEQPSIDDTGLTKAEKETMDELYSKYTDILNKEFQGKEIITKDQINLRLALVANPKLVENSKSSSLAYSLTKNWLEEGKLMVEALKKFGVDSQELDALFAIERKGTTYLSGGEPQYMSESSLTPDDKRALKKASKEEYIKGPAFKTVGGKIYSGKFEGPQSDWHYNVIETIPENERHAASYGFVTNTGRFISRKEAARIARDSGQLYERAADRFDLGDLRELDSSHINLSNTPQYASEGSLTPDDKRAIRKAPKEGKQPYPFKLSELERGDTVKQETFARATEAIKEGEDYGVSALESSEKPEVKQAVELARTQSAALNQDAPTLTQRNSFVPALTSRYDKVQEALKTKEGKMAAEALHRFEGKASLRSANIGHKLVSATSDYTPDEIGRVYRYGHNLTVKEPNNIRLTPRENKLWDAVRQIHEDARTLQNELGLLVREGEVYRAGGISPEGYIGSLLDQKVAYEWSNNPTGELAKSYDKAYVDFMVKRGLTPKEAKDALNKYKTQLGDFVPQSIEFGALRKAKGKGLPWELVEKNFNRYSTRYGNRAGRDLAYFEELQNKPEIRKILALRDQYGKLPSPDELKELTPINSNPAVEEAMKSVYGLDRQSDSPKITASSRAVVNTMMGVGTSARNLVGLGPTVAAYVQVKQIPLAFKAIANMSKSRVRALENGAVKPSFAEFDAAGYYEGNPNPFIRLANRYSDFMRKYQGRNLSDKWEAEYLYSLGELLAVDNIANAKLGNKESIHFLERFADIVEGGKDALLKRQVTQDDIGRIAKRFVDASRGTYGPEGLPSWALEGQLAPFTSLSRWSIEKSNTIWKDVVLPMKKGIYGPFLRYALGAAGAGYLVEQLNEELSNKRGAEPTVSEVIASGSKEDVMAKMISLFQLASFAGIVSDGAQLVSAAWRNKSLKYSNPLSFPLYSWLSDTMASNISGYLGALKSGEDPFQATAKFLQGITTGSVQTARYIDNNFIHPEEAKRKERFRDYNVWQQLTDRREETPSVTTPATEYANLGEKSFKKEQNLSKALGMLPKLISKAIDRSKKGSILDIEQLKKELRSLKQNSYQTMPDMDNAPQAFYEYLKHLRVTQGEEAARDRLNDYITTRMRNQIKSEAVPSL